MWALIMPNPCGSVWLWGHDYRRIGSKNIQKGNLYSLTYLSKIKEGEGPIQNIQLRLYIPSSLLPSSYPTAPEPLTHHHPPIPPPSQPEESCFLHFLSPLSLNSPLLDLLSLSSKSFTSSHQLLLFLHHHLLLHLREGFIPEATGEEPKKAVSSSRAGQGWGGVGWGVEGQPGDNSTHNRTPCHISDDSQPSCESHFCSRRSLDQLINAISNFPNNPEK